MNVLRNQVVYMEVLIQSIAVRKEPEIKRPPFSLVLAYFPRQEFDQSDDKLCLV